MENYAYIVLVKRADGKLSFVSCSNEEIALEFTDNTEDVQAIYRIDEYGHTQEMERGVKLVEKEKPKPKAMIGNTPVYGVQPLSINHVHHIVPCGVDPVEKAGSCNLGELPTPNVKKPIARVFVYADVVGGVTEEHTKAYKHFEELLLTKLHLNGYDIKVEFRKAVHAGWLSSLNGARQFTPDHDGTPSWSLALAHANKHLRNLDAHEKAVVLLLSGGKYNIPLEVAEERIEHELKVMSRYADFIPLYQFSYTADDESKDMFNLIRRIKYKKIDNAYTHKFDLNYNSTLTNALRRQEGWIPEQLRGGKQ